jgi:BirA family transcriptional regulator, biotin operon repressor / biotin---[acetyl-CoA-carboxylase] ligase
MAMFDRLIIYPEAGSTQDVAKELALRGEPEGTAVMAVKQTKGRGRSGHSWVSPPGKNLALSLILRPRIDPARAGLLGLLTSIAVAETCEILGVPKTELKWPNDVLVDGRKIAGILSEATMDDRTVRSVIVGIGLNVNMEQADFPSEFRDSATSLLLCTGKVREVEETARLLLGRLRDLYQRAKQKGYAFIPALWEIRWAHRGRTLSRNGVVGRGEGVGADGALLLRTGDGNLCRVTSGEVQML